MHTADFLEDALPSQARGARGRAWPAAHHPQLAGAGAANQAWHDVLAQHQAIYEELLTSPEWAGPHERPAPSQLPLSARDLTRDLAGWGPPPGALRADSF